MSKFHNQNKSGRRITGTIEGNPRGFAFLVPDEDDEDIFIPARALNGAMHGDRAECVISPRTHNSSEGEVVRILERGFTTIVGKYERGRGFGFVRSDNPKFSRDVYIAQGDDMGASSGQKVVCEIDSYPEGKSPNGHITEILGYEGAKGVDVLSVLRSYGLKEQFPLRVTREARAVPSSVSEEISKVRRDFRADTVITIDGDDSKDFDDAVCVKKRGNGYRLYVHIADVAEYVKAGTELDKEAFSRGTSVYFCDRVLPMLPEELSNGICSLNEGVDRLTLSVIIDFSGDGSVERSEICEGVIRSRHRMTYKNVAAIIDGDKRLSEQYSDIVPMIADMNRLADLLYYVRKKRGSVNLSIVESKVIIDKATGKATDVVRYPILKSNGIIEEFMLAANEAVAERFAKLKCPFVYRTHETPSQEKTQSLVNFLSAIGITFRGNTLSPKPRDFAELVDTVDESKASVVNRMTLRSMMKAKYEPENKGHFGLAAEFYCHFTSPIRRYPDLAVHRIIKDWLRGGESGLNKYRSFVAETSVRGSERERIAESAERDVDDLKKAEYMSEHIGEQYDGVISGVTEWGLYVELENGIEGLVRVSSLGGNGFVFNPDLLRLDGGSYSYGLGDPMRIVVYEAGEGKITFKPVV